MPRRRETQLSCLHGVEPVVLQVFSNSQGNPVYGIRLPPFPHLPSQGWRGVVSICSVAVTALAPFHCHRERTGRSKGLCLTIDSDPVGGSGRQGHRADPAPPLLASAKFTEATGLSRSGGWGNKSIRWPLIPTWGGSQGGHLGLRLGIWLKTAVSCSTPSTNL